MTSHPTPSTSGRGLPQATDEAQKRVEILSEWQKLSDERINKLLVVVSVVVILYAYYGFLSPWITARRLQQLGRDRADLERVTQQFKNLRDRYSFLVLPAVSSGVQAAEDIGLFVDVIIPTIDARLVKGEQDLTAQIKAELPSVTTESVRRLGAIQSDRKTLDATKHDMMSLSALYNEHRNRHPATAVGITNVNEEIIRGYLASYRSSLSSLLFGGSFPLNDEAKPTRSQTPDNDRLRDKQAIAEMQALLLGQSDAHLGVENDPVNDLEKLIQLEAVIKDLKQFDATNANSSLCEEARLELAQKPQFKSIRLGDTLTKSFHPYSKLSEYTAPTIPFSLSETTDLNTYRTIAKDLGAPFEVTTLGDLYRLDEFANSVIDKTNAETQSMVLNIPFLDVNIDRFVVLIAVPILVAVFFHMILVDLRRSCRLVRELEKEESYNLTLLDHVRYSPHNMLVSDVFEAETASRVNSARRHFATLAKWLILGLSLLLPIIFIWNSYRAASRVLSFHIGTSIFIGLLMAAFLTFEVVSITRFVRKNYRV